MSFQIEQGEKFAFIAFSGIEIGIDDRTPNPAELGFNCWAFARMPFPFDAWWREQLGKVVTEGKMSLCLGKVLRLVVTVGSISVVCSRHGGLP